jgi:ATP-dependent phosphofructokinase / diphosphate-dependent phosphofructokinase
MTIRIAVNTGGGDAPGLNAVLRAIVLSARSRGWDVFGIKYGYRGLVEDDPAGIMALDRDAVRGITHLGGSILGNTNRGDPFNYPVRTNGQLVPTDLSEKVIRRFKELGFTALVAIGGDGSAKLAHRLLEKGLPRVIAVPKTIDNDLLGTDLTFGFETAVTTAVDALDKLHSTTQAHERVMVVEVMGRYAGWIALYAGIAGGADAILIPEIPFDLDSVAEKIQRRERSGRPFSLVVVAEGARPVGGEMLVEEVKDVFSEHQRLVGIADFVARGLKQRTNKDTRHMVLGHLQRGGTPVVNDRLLALRFGCAVTRFLEETTESGLVALRAGETRLVPLSEVTRGLRNVPLDSSILQTGRDLGLSFGDEPPGMFARETLRPLGMGLKVPPQPTAPVQALDVLDTRRSDR